jgi:hypothetical protein
MGVDGVFGKRLRRMIGVLIDFLLPMILPREFFRVEGAGCFLTKRSLEACLRYNYKIIGSSFIKTQS